MAERHLLINHDWTAGQGDALQSRDPASGAVIWSGRSASARQIDAAVDAARGACEYWAALPLDSRIAYLREFASRVSADAYNFAALISRETGKPLWESKQEADLVVRKVDLSLRAHEQRRSPSVNALDGAVAALRYKPHGVVAVFGPFNLPAHLPNGHIVPALLAGNCVIFKPSEKTPAVGQRMVELWQQAKLPEGVVNLVQGARDVGAALAQHRGIDGVYFTGSLAGGRAIRYACADQPNKILALEMGGNNPLVVHEAGDLNAAAYLTVLSAYITAGQRCSCARRLIVPRGDEGDRFIARLVKLIGAIRVGVWDDEPPPFMGPLVDRDAARAVQEAHDQLRQSGGAALVELKPMGRCEAMLTPGLIDVSDVPDRPDEEFFGPLLQLIRVADFDAAIAEANNTRFGLVAALISDEPALYQRFHAKVRAGVINWNRQSTGASGALPFGGVGLSGNHRPSGFWAADYCSYPIASLEADELAMPAQLTPGLEP